MARHAPAVLFALLAVTIVLPGCPAKQATRPRSSDPSTPGKETTVEKGVTIEDDQGKSRIRFIGSKTPYGRGTGGNNVYLLRSWLDRDTREISHQVYVTDRYLQSEPRRWESATGNKGERLKFTAIDAKVENCSPAGCPRMEAFGAGIEDRVLRAAADRGYTIEFAAQDGSKETIRLLPGQIQSQLDAIDRRRASLPPVKKATPKPAAKKPAKKAPIIIRDTTGY